MKNFRTYHLAVQFYHQIQTVTVPGHLRNQLDRAASSIPLNLAEGQGRIGQKDKLRFYRYAFGSVCECQSILALIRTDTAVHSTLDRLAASLYRLIQNAAR